MSQTPAVAASVAQPLPAMQRCLQLLGSIGVARTTRPPPPLPVPAAVQMGPAEAMCSSTGPTHLAAPAKAMHTLTAKQHRAGLANSYKTAISVATRAPEMPLTSFPPAAHTCVTNGACGNPATPARHGLVPVVAGPPAAEALTKTANAEAPSSRIWRRGAAPSWPLSLSLWGPARRSCIWGLGAWDASGAAADGSYTGSGISYAGGSNGAPPGVVACWGTGAGVGIGDRAARFSSSAGTGTDAGNGGSEGASGKWRTGWGGSGSGSRGGRSGGSGAPFPLHFSPTASHYEVLGVPRNATLAAIKAAFRQRAKELHPDAVAARARGQHYPPLHAQHRQHVRPASGLGQSDPLSSGSLSLSESERDAGAAAFLRLMTAYEVLSNPQGRRAYDMQLAAAAAAAGSGGGGGRPTGRQRPPPATTGGAARQGGAAAGGPGPGYEYGAGSEPRGAESAGGSGGGSAAAGGGGNRTDALHHIDFRSWRYGMGEWMMRPRREPVAGRSAALEYYLRKYSSEFEGALHAALVHAYLGPKLDLSPGELPRCFEGELRRAPGLSAALMQLVSGRTLLGSVRVREPLCLESGAGGTGAEHAAALPSGDSRALSGTAAAAAAVSRSATVGHGAGAATGADGMHPVAGTLTENDPGPGAVDSNVTSGSAAGFAVKTDGAGGVNLTASTGPGGQLGRATSASAAANIAMREGEFSGTPAAAPGFVTDGAATRAMAAATGDAPPANPALSVNSAAGAVTTAAADPLDGLDAAALHSLSYDDDAVVQLAAASLAAERDARSAAGYGHLVPGYSRLRGMLDLYGFYPDPAALQRRSTQISLVTAAEAAQARDAAGGGGALGGRRLMEHWRRGTNTAAAAATAEAEAVAGAPGRSSALTDGKAPGVNDGVQAAAAAGTVEDEGEGSTGLPPGIMPPPQLQALVEATHDAEAAEARALAEAVAEAARFAPPGPPRPPAPPPPVNDPRTWAFGPDYPHHAAGATAGNGGAGGAAAAGGGETVLELRMGQDLTAVAVFQPWAQPAAAAASAPSASESNSGGTAAPAHTAVTDATVPHAAAASAPESRSKPGSGSMDSGSPLDRAPEGTVVPLFGPVVEGRVKVYVGGQLAAGVEGRHVFDPEGRRVGLMVRGSFPGLRTLHFFDASTRRLRLLCRCVRARLLPSPTWLFPPREETHDVGGWYFEWGGYGRRGQPGWLHPAVYVFVASLVAAEQERVAAARRAAVRGVLGGWRDAARRALGAWRPRWWGARE